MTITLEQIAKLAGVSLTTASRVINKFPGVRPATRERVLQVIRQYGYRPNSAARTQRCPILRNRFRKGVIVLGSIESFDRKSIY